MAERPTKSPQLDVRISSYQASRSENEKIVAIYFRDNIHEILDSDYVKVIVDKDSISFRPTQEEYGYKVNRQVLVSQSSAITRITDYGYVGKEFPLRWDESTKRYHIMLNEGTPYEQGTANAGTPHDVSGVTHGAPSKQENPIEIASATPESIPEKENNMADTTNQILTTKQSTVNADSVKEYLLTLVEQKAKEKDCDGILAIMQVVKML